MSTPLTPEEIYNNVSTELTGSVPGIGINTLVKRCMEQYADQQTAALREELEALETAAKHDIHELTEERDNYRDELEAVKKERDEWKGRYEFVMKATHKVQDQNDNLRRQRDEAVKLLELIIELNAYETAARFREPGNRLNRPDLVNDIDLFLSRLSSGETKPEVKESSKSQFVNLMVGIANANSMDAETAKNYLEEGGIDTGNLVSEGLHKIKELMNPSEIPNSSKPEITDAEFEKCPICHIGDWTVVIDDFGNRTNKCFECGVETLPAPPESLTDKE